MAQLIFAFLSFAQEPKNHIESIESNQLKYFLVIWSFGDLRKSIQKLLPILTTIYA